MRQREPSSRPERVPVALPQIVSGPAAWLRSSRLSGFTVLMFVVVVMFVIIVAPGLRVFIEQRQQLAELQAAVDDRSAENDRLTAEVARWSDPAYIKAEARDRLYYVMPGEISFLVIDDAPAASGDAAAVSDTITATQVDWLSSLLVSGVTAGLSTQTPEQLENDGAVQ
ncbi:septum formation initiator family protein [Herbiconiux moechotypicola]|uniref:Septum formation initiator family protein n=1 Tax=Herbiconiux moechotypicola TaxID=637393 RepID=A0ABN3E665_9MICO|nr:septum formation initiator family protein [Herbiconiux moechotypicola]MCS5731869.1 septum formation initiator family protein [Herbiconiux moechotypicola]